MAENKTSQAQQNTPNVAPPNGGFYNPFRGLIEEQLKRTEAFWKDVAEMEAKNAEQARAAIDESAKLMKETLDYGLKLSAEWRKMAMEATKRAADMSQAKV